MLTKAQARSLVFQTNAAEFVNTEIASREEAQKGVTREERLKFYREAEKDPELQREIADARVTKIGIDVLAHTWAMSFFEVESLQANEVPVVTNIRIDPIDRPYTVKYLGEATGGAPKRQVVESGSTLEFRMKRISTEEVEYPLMDINYGFLDLQAQVDRRLTYELDLKIDQEAKKLLDSAKLSSGLRSTMRLHSAIEKTNIPDANYLDHSGVEASGKLTVEKFKRLLDYFARFAADVEEDGSPLQLKAIYLASTSMRDLWDMVDLVAGYNIGGDSVVDPKNTIPSEARTNIYRSGKLEQMFGHSFAIVTRNTLKAPTAYVATNKPVGKMWVKPSMDMMHVDNSMAKSRQNKNSALMQKVMQMSTFSDFTKNFLVWKY